MAIDTIRRFIKNNLVFIITIYIAISILSSMFIALSEAGKQAGDSGIYKNNLVGCEIDSPWTRIFFSKLFCQIPKKGNN